MSKNNTTIKNLITFIICTIHCNGVKCPATDYLQYLDALKRFTPDTASKEFHDFLGELDEAGATQKEGDLDWMESMTKSLDEERRVQAYNIQRAGDAREKIGYRRNSSESGAVRIWGGRSADA